MNCKLAIGILTAIYMYVFYLVFYEERFWNEPLENCKNLLSQFLDIGNREMSNILSKNSKNFIKVYSRQSKIRMIN